MSCFGMLDCLLQLLDGVRHMLMLFGVLLFRRLSMIQTFFRMFEQHFCVTVLAMCLSHRGMLDCLGSMVPGSNDRSTQKNSQDADSKSCWCVFHENLHKVH